MSGSAFERPSPAPGDQPGRASRRVRVGPEPEAPAAARQLSDGEARPSARQVRALQGAVGNHALSRLLDGSGGAIQRAKNPERERLERIRMWSQLLQQKDGLAPAAADTLAEAFANTKTSIVTLEEFAPLLGLGWTAPVLVTLIRKFVGDPGGREASDWVAFAGRRPDNADAVADGVRAGQVDWVNVAASFRTHNDRYTATPQTPTGKVRVCVLDGDHAALEEQTLDGTQTVYRITGGRAPFLASDELKDLLLADSQYNVSATGYTRHATVNLVEAPGQVDFAATRHFTYMPSAGTVNTAIMSSDDADITVLRLEGDSVIFDISGAEHALSLSPVDDYMPFDFDYNAAAGTISHGHPGHALYTV